jgi:ketosteroid isomerase-like protein
MLVSSRHAKIVRRAFDLFEAGDVEGLLALYHPDVEVGDAGSVRPPAHTYVGIERVREYLREIVAEGANVRVEDLELIEADGRVIVNGRVPAADIAMRWRFDFEDDLIARVVPLEADGAVLGGRDFTLGQVVERSGSGRVELRFSDGRSLIAPIAAALEPWAAVQEPVLAYFDGDRLAGWYLPDHQLGMDLR